jgi:predicted  nucleic acid-binding Zn-ribbon protein
MRRRAQNDERTVPDIPTLPEKSTHRKGAIVEAERRITQLLDMVSVAQQDANTLRHELDEVRKDRAALEDTYEGMPDVESESTP